MVISAWGRALAPIAPWKPCSRWVGGLEPNEFCFAAAISACAKAGEWERALAVYDDMGSRGLVADIVTFDALLAACDKGEQWERALAALNELLDLGLQPTKPFLGDMRVPARRPVGERAAAVARDASAWARADHDRV